MRAQLCVSGRSEKGPLLGRREELLAAMGVAPNDYRAGRIAGYGVLRRWAVRKANVDGHIEDMQVSDGERSSDRSLTVAARMRHAART